MLTHPCLLGAANSLLFSMAMQDAGFASNSSSYPSGNLENLQHAMHRAQADEFDPVNTTCGKCKTTPRLPVCGTRRAWVFVAEANWKRLVHGCRERELLVMGKRFGGCAHRLDH